MLNHLLVGLFFLVWLAGTYTLTKPVRRWLEGSPHPAEE